MREGEREWKGGSELGSLNLQECKSEKERWRGPLNNQRWRRRKVTFQSIETKDKCMVFKTKFYELEFVHHFYHNKLTFQNKLFLTLLH